MKSLHCNLHLQQFALYCDRCLEPICQKCTVIGPHNTSIHSLTPLHQAYQRRVQQFNTRLNNITQVRELALTKITQLTARIQTENLRKQQIIVENEKNRAQIEQRLQKQYENIVSIISKEQEVIIEHLNQINDLGHQFQQLSTTNNIECLINYQRIMNQFREIIDQIQILLDKNVEIQQLPKQLSDIRIKLKVIEGYQELFQRKTAILGAMIKKLAEQKGKISAVKIDYAAMLVQINNLLQKFDNSQGEYSLNLEKPNHRKTHFVCNFCGIIMDDESINTNCSKNQLVQQTKTSQSYFSYGSSSNNNNKSPSSIDINLQGYCKKVPEIVFYGTNRHYFGQPVNPNIFFRAAYLNIILGKEVLGLFVSFLPQADQQLRIVNQSSKALNNSFTNYLDLLLLKILCLAKVRGVSLARYFKKQDIAPGDNKLGYCQSVAMQYILMEIIGLTQAQAHIIIDISDFPCVQTEEFMKNSALPIRNYSKLLEKLGETQI